MDLTQIPTDLRDAVQMYRKIRDIEDDFSRLLAPYLEKKKEIEKYFLDNLTIPDGEFQSEKVSFPGVGSLSKKKQVVAKVQDWDAFQAYLVRNEMGGVIRHQANLAATAELYDLIMAGEMPMPKSVEFDFIEKLSFRKA